MNESKRKLMLSELEQRFEPFTNALVSELQNWQFTFKEQRLVHLLHLDPALVVRHSLPYCITQEAYFGLDEQDVGFFAAIILLHSLALTRIDNYYDGGNQTRGGVLNVEDIAYSLGATHEAAAALLKRTPNTTELAKLLEVTTFVHARMFKDHLERYNPAFLERPEQQLQAYLHSSKSRLLGSGYWEVMARAAFVQHGKPFPMHLHSIDIKLRKLRQIIDELADVEEDLRGGLITLPLLHALTQKPELMRQNIQNYWHAKDEAKDCSHILASLAETQTKQWIYSQAMALYESAMDELDTHLGNSGDGYRQLFEFKRAKLEMLM